VDKRSVLGNLASRLLEFWILQWK